MGDGERDMEAPHGRPSPAGTPRCHGVQVGPSRPHGSGGALGSAPTLCCWCPHPVLLGADRPGHLGTDPSLRDVWFGPGAVDFWRLQRREQGLLPARRGSSPELSPGLPNPSWGLHHQVAPLGAGARPLLSSFHASSYVLHPTRKVRFIPVLQGCKGSEKLRDLPKVTQPGSSKARI